MFFYIGYNNIKILDIPSFKIFYIIHFAKKIKTKYGCVCMYNAFIYLILKCSFLFKILNILLINIINKK